MKPEQRDRVDLRTNTDLCSIQQMVGCIIPARPPLQFSVCRDMIILIIIRLASLFLSRACPSLSLRLMRPEDPFSGVGPDSLLVQHGEEAVPAEEARDHQDHVRRMAVATVS